jgi:CheY-like chemotaxis protein
MGARILVVDDSPTIRKVVASILEARAFDMERGLSHMDVYGVEYYVSFTEEAAEKARGIDGFTEIASPDPGPFHIFGLPDTDLVVAATHEPAVYEVPDRGIFASIVGSGASPARRTDPPQLREMALDWYEDVDNMDRWVVADGPRNGGSDPSGRPDVR